MFTDKANRSGCHYTAEILLNLNYVHAWLANMSLCMPNIPGKWTVVFFFVSWRNVSSLIQVSANGRFPLPYKLYSCITTETSAIA